MCTDNGPNTRVRRKHLATCLVAGLALVPLSHAGPRDPAAIDRLRDVRDAGRAHFESASVAGSPLRHDGLARAPAASGPATTFTVTNCDDDGAGSFRAAAALAGPSDIIDLGGLACSTISLTTGAVTIGDTTVNANGRDQLTIDGRDATPVLHHTGTGRLYLNGLTIANGKYTTAASPQGGCIRSEGSVWLFGVSVRNCHVETTGTASATGGAISAQGDVVLVQSTVTLSSVASSEGQDALGGGVYTSASLYTVGSTISDNTANGADNITGRGGAAFVGYLAVLQESTVSGNSAQIVGGVLANVGEPGVSVVYESTLSGNRSTDSKYGSGFYAASNLTIANSTITGNTESNPAGLTRGAGVALGSTSYAYVVSTLVAGNATISATAIVPSDVGSGGNAHLNGSHNWINQSTIALPGDTRAGDPLLAPLADNGGVTATHALLRASPAIDAGLNPTAFTFDQRGSGFARTIGGAPDIGAFENQGGPDDLIFLGVFDPPL